MPKEPPFAFPTKVGTTWVYEVEGKEKTLVISRSENETGGTLVTTEWVIANGNRTPHMVISVTDKGVFLVTEDGVKYDERVCVLKLPHIKGQTWQANTSKPMPFIAIAGTKTAGPIERVKVPAGEFNAARVDSSFTFNGGLACEATHWYAHGIGLVQLDDDLKLKSFKPGRD